MAESFSRETVGSLPEHPLEGSTISNVLGLEDPTGWGTNKCHKFLTMLDDKPFWTMLEVFCDDFIHMAQTSDPG